MTISKLSPIWEKRVDIYSCGGLTGKNGAQVNNCK